MTPLAALPTEHELRRAPLVMFGAFFIYPGEKIKRFVKPAWKIATKSFNDLGPAWTDHATWLTALPPFHKL